MAVQSVRRGPGKRTKSKALVINFIHICAIKAVQEKKKEKEKFLDEDLILIL